jgi:hypothetical protein
MAFIEAITLTEVPGGNVTAADITEKPTPSQRVNSVEEAPPYPKASLNASKTESVEISSADASANQRLNNRWDQVYAKVKEQNPKLAGVLNSTKLRVLKGNVLTLGFNGDFYLKTLENPASLELIKNVLKQVMDMEIEVQAELVSGKKSSPPTDVDSDGMVASALRDLGGEIVDIQ